MFMFRIIKSGKLALVALAVVMSGAAIQPASATPIGVVGPRHHRWTCIAQDWQGQKFRDSGLTRRAAALGARANCHHGGGKRCLVVFCY